MVTEKKKDKESFFSYRLVQNKNKNLENLTMNVSY